MKKNLSIFLTILLFVFITSGSAVAIDNADDPGSVLTAGTDTEELLEFTFSPQVAGKYEQSGNQWYVIATYHTGGTRTYATAQNITSIYKTKTSIDGEDVTILDFTNVIEEPASADDWSGGVWER